MPPSGSYGRKMTRFARALGIVQAWFARGYREGTIVERICIFPSWLLFRTLFAIAFGLVRIRARAEAL